MVLAAYMYCRVSAVDQNLGRQIVFGAVFQNEREYLLQRQAEGIAAASARDVRFGRHDKKPHKNFSALVEPWGRGKLPAKNLMAQTGLKKIMLYRRLRDFKLSWKNDNGAVEILNVY
jgi:DNA invertase Pin-like site-specific DNA recombinase